MVTGDCHANDYDVDGDPHTGINSIPPDHGHGSIYASGYWEYTPAANFNGVDHMHYRVSDGTTFSAYATITITVTPVNDLPVAVDDTATVAEDTTLTVSAPGVLGNDTDVETPTVLGVNWHSTAAHGSLTVDGNGAWTYRPAPNYNGPDSFDYTCEDASGGISATATVDIDVTPTGGTVARIPGGDRYGVAANAARMGWFDDDGAWTGTNHVVVACGEPGKEADPLAAAGLAGLYDAPILLVRNSGTLPTATKNLIKAIGSANTSISVHIVGGTASVPSACARALDALPGVNHVTRVSGADRYAVTANIAKRMAKEAGTASIPAVLIVCAEPRSFPNAFYDALAVSPAAWQATMPMLAVRYATVPSSVNSLLTTGGLLAGKDRYVVSCNSYISDSVVTRLHAVATIAGDAYPYNCASDIASFSIDAGWLEAHDVGVASKLSDALAGGAFMGRRGGVLLYTTPRLDLPMQPVSAAWITARKDQIANGWVFGSTASVSLPQETEFQALIE